MENINESIRNLLFERAPSGIEESVLNTNIEEFMNGLEKSTLYHTGTIKPYDEKYSRDYFTMGYIGGLNHMGLERGTIAFKSNESNLLNDLSSAKSYDFVERNGIGLQINYNL